jgi:uncharacterized damage-inducible protein DinB
MHLFMVNYLNNLEEIHAEIRNAIKGLPQEALDWNTGNDMNSMAVLVIHIIGAERYWIGDVIRSDDSQRDRDAEFRVRGLTEADLVQKLDQVESYVQGALENLSLRELGEKRISPRHDREVTVGWALCHALKHTALHAGHIQVTRQWWEERSID